VRVRAPHEEFELTATNLNHQLTYVELLEAQPVRITRRWLRRPSDPCRARTVARNDR